MFKSTTILAVLHGGILAMGGDGQVTLHNTVVKHGARKVKLLSNGDVLAGFAGSASDAFTLFERFESKLSESGGVLARAAVELAKDWRSDKVLRRLEAMLIVGDASQIFLLSGAGDIIQPDEGVLAIGSGGSFALSAAKAIIKVAPDLGARKIVEESMAIAAQICPFTNDRIYVEEVRKKI
ncbi:MAG TPA: ATP-dependent protease subunit HslV [Oligoflexia bacterium]|nr:ATP-dependent protease subunit HslV [Oligoflexia bacterium]HMP48864.1 ATP-dependent protease subunit HslV [Oligoflexia bacterium]